MLPSGRLRAALVALYVITRLRGLGLLPIFLDETLHVRWALLVSQGDKPWDATWKWGRALTIWMGALVSPWAQDLLRANRLVSVAIGVATLFATFEIARRLLGPREALVAGLFYVLCPFTLFYDRMALTEAGLSAAFALTLVFSIRMSESGRPLDAALAGLMLVLAVLVKAIGVLVLPIPLVTLLVLGRIRERWKALALAYAVGVPPIALALRLFVASENAQHMAQLFTGGGGALAARLGQNLAEGAGWLWTWWTAPLVVLAAIGALVALVAQGSPGPAARPPRALSARRLLRGAHLAHAALPAAGFGPAAGAGRGCPRAARVVGGRAAARIRTAASRARACWHSRWSRCCSRPCGSIAPSGPIRRGPRFPRPIASSTCSAGPRATACATPSGSSGRSSAQHPDGVTVVVHANRYQNLRMTPLTLGLAFAREPRVRLEDWDFADPAALRAFEKWAAAGPTLLVVPRADPSAPAPDAASWRHLAMLVARTTKPDGQPCDDVYRLCAPPQCAGAPASP